MVRNGRMRAERHDRVERGAVRAQSAHIVFEECRDLGFRHALFDFGQELQKALLRNIAGAGDIFKLPFVLDRHTVAERGRGIDERQPHIRELFIFGIERLLKGDPDGPVLFQKLCRSIRKTVHFLDAHFRTLQQFFRRLGIAGVGIQRRAVLIREDKSALRQKSRNISFEIFTGSEHGIRTDCIENLFSVRFNHNLSLFLYIVAKKSHFVNRTRKAIVNYYKFFSSPFLAAECFLTRNTAPSTKQTLEKRSADEGTRTKGNVNGAERVMNNHAESVPPASKRPPKIKGTGHREKDFISFVSSKTSHAPSPKRHKKLKSIPPVIISKFASASASVISLHMVNPCVKNIRAKIAAEKTIPAKATNSKTYAILNPFFFFIVALIFSPFSFTSRYKCASSPRRPPPACPRIR